MEVEQSDELISDATDPGFVIDMQIEFVPKTCTNLIIDDVVLKSHTVKDWYDDQLTFMVNEEGSVVQDYEVTDVEDVDNTTGNVVMNVTVDTIPICEHRMRDVINRLVNPDPHCIRPVVSGITCTAILNRLTIDCHKMTPIMLEIKPKAILDNANIKVFDNLDINILMRNMEIFIKWMEQQMETGKGAVAYNDYSIDNSPSNVSTISLSVALEETEEMDIEMAIETICDPDDDGNYAVKISSSGEILGSGPHSNFNYGTPIYTGEDALLKTEVVRKIEGCAKFTERVLNMNIYNLNEQRRLHLIDHVNNVYNQLLLQQ
ncbi:MAG: hypothetical protein CMI56_00825 [Parcubacteria group bacterium]|nr:hypothetical protein [Parcubacteria group bacterium]|tara:strand:- start:444 stop:1397 length:954 start_codon:yes stop_codon:yes gene_type:complete